MWFSLHNKVTYTIFYSLERSKSRSFMVVQGLGFLRITWIIGNHSNGIALRTAIIPAGNVIGQKRISPDPAFAYDYQGAQRLEISLKPRRKIK